MRELHKAALVRAYRTLAQGFGGTTVSGALALVFTDPANARNAIVVALGSTVVAAVISFWQGVAQGLPEAQDYDTY